MDDVDENIKKDLKGIIAKVPAHAPITCKWPIYALL
jgi:hypothetical protein